MIAINAGWSEGGTLGKHTVKIGVLPCGDIERPARTQSDKGIQTNLPWQVHAAEHTEAVPNVKRRASVFSGKVIRIDREQTPSLSVGVVLSLAQRIVCRERDRSIEPIVESHKELILIKPATRLVLIEHWCRSRQTL